MARKDIRNTIVEKLLSPEGVSVTRRIVDVLIKEGGDPDVLQPLYDVRGMLLKLAAEPTE